MKKTAVTVALGFAVMASFAQAPKGERPKYTKEEIVRIRAEQHEKMLKINGGTIVKPDSAKGEIVFFNAQRRISEKRAAGSFRYLAKNFKINYKVVTASSPVSVTNAAALCKAHKANAAVFLVDDPTLTSMSVVSPDERWAIVNIAALTADNPAESFVVARTHKEVVRALLYAMNAGDTQKGEGLMSPMTCLKDLDDLASSLPPADVTARVMKNLPKLGLARIKTSTYREACQEGWAPQPTNDYQKAIWEEVHTPPEKPLKITYDKDKQKPVVK